METYKGFKWWVKRDGIHGAWSGFARCVGAVIEAHGKDYVTTPRQYGTGAKARAKQIILARIDAAQHSVEPTRSNVGDLPAVVNQSNVESPE